MVLEKVTTVTTIRATVADTLRFVAYHLNLGVDKMYLFFDDPDDAALSALRALKR